MRAGLYLDVALNIPQYRLATLQSLHLAEPWTLDHQEVRDKTNDAQEELARTLSIHVARKEVGDWGVSELQRVMNAFRVHFLFANNASTSPSCLAVTTSTRTLPEPSPTTWAEC